MNGDNRPVCWVIAGPNGAGKTTFALRYIPEAADCRNFVNADLIAAGILSGPLRPSPFSALARTWYLRTAEEGCSRAKHPHSNSQ